MSAHPAAALLAKDLGRLPHTNKRGEKGLIHIPGFLSTTGASEEQAAEAGLLALAIAEGVIEDLGVHGYQVIHKGELDAKVKAATAEKQTSNELALYCNRCHQAVLKVDVSVPAPKLHLRTAIAVLSAHVEGCK